MSHARPVPVSAAGDVAAPGARWRMLLTSLILAIGPIILALVTCGVIVALLGRDPISFFWDILDGGVLRKSGFQDSVTHIAPVLLIAAGLIVAFRASLWNLGGDGQYLLAFAMIAGLGPSVLANFPGPIGWTVLCLVAVAVGAAWTIVPAVLKVRYGLNEIVTSLMMTFIGVGLANLLIKFPFRGPTVIPQTAVIDPSLMFVDLPGTRIHIGVVIALVMVVIVHLVLTRTSFGTRIDVLGANPRAAVHLGIDVPRLTVVVFLVSGGLIGLAAAVDMLGTFGYMRADWDPAYGLKVVPLVFLARLNALAVIPFAAFFSVLSIGGDYAARKADLPNVFLLLVVGLILLFMVVTHYLGDRRSRGEPVLPARLRRPSADTPSAQHA